MRWFLFAVSLFALWFAFNTLFMVPGVYSKTTIALAGFGIAVGAATAWFSGRQFVLAWRRNDRLGEIMKTPPVVLCTFVLCVFCIIGVIKLWAYR